MWHMYNGMGWWTAFAAIWNIFFLTALIVLVVWIVRRLAGRGHDDVRGPEKQDALEIAKQRYARGEITKEEFEEIKRNLTTP